MIRRVLFTLAATLAAAVLHTWPLASDLGGLSRHDNADTTLTTWIVSWVAHALPRDPVHVFDAPIFHPEKRTLAYSEPLLVPGAMAIRCARRPRRHGHLQPARHPRPGAERGGDVAARGRLTGDKRPAPCRARLRVQRPSAHPLRTPAGAARGVFPIVLYAIDRLATRAKLRDGIARPRPGARRPDVGLSARLAAGATVAGLLARAGEWRRRPLATVVRGRGITLGSCCWRRCCAT
jgi:hypothetical protein